MTAEPAPDVRLVDVCAEADLPDGEVAVVDDATHGRIAVFAVEGEHFGLQDECSHQQAWLSEGFVEGCAVECPLHASMFDLRTGVPGGPPAREAVATYAARVEDGRVVVQVPA